MIQTGSVVRIVDNTGAKNAICIKIKPSYRAKFGYAKDMIVVSVRSLRSKRRERIKVKKGEVYYAVILKSRTKNRLFSGDSVLYNEKCSAVLLNKQKKIFGTRVFGSLSRSFRGTSYLKVLSLCSAIHAD